MVVGCKSLRLSSQRNDWGFGAGVKFDGTGDDGNFYEEISFY